MEEKAYRFKRVLTDNTFYFSEISGILGEVFYAAHKIATDELDLLYIDVYDGDRILARFFRVIY